MARARATSAIAAAQAGNPWPKTSPLAAPASTGATTDRALLPAAGPAARLAGEPPAHAAAGAEVVKTPLLADWPRGEAMSKTVRFSCTSVAIAALISSGLVPIAFGREEAQARSTGMTYATPEAAVTALIDALRRNNMTALESVLGLGSRDVVDSGDPIADAAARDDFVTAYDVRSNIVAVNDNTRRLQVGETDWPLAIPIVRDSGRWRFDLETGRDELINRRIGRNELNAIEASQAFIDAQQEYASEDRDGDGILEYAQRFISISGTRDGLYWPTKEDEPESPLGPLFATARADGYQPETAVPGSTYYGYRYRILTSQGASAAGGAYNYLVGDNMISGVAMIAYPAEYGASGITSFIVNHDGDVYQKDLGTGTDEAVARITSFDPNTWTRVQIQTPIASAR
jgi:hypothetical protein